ncbi:MAG: glycosyl transferase [Akkermansiaceae bacterium]|nr:glycosyl transferase [Verrucomicrobiales bacterium]
MQASANNALWQLIDGVLVVNLDQRPDRWAEFQRAVQGIIPPEKLHRLPARWGRDIPGFGQPPWFRGGKRDNTWAGRAGCLQSHRNALLKAREAGWRTVLLLEDDGAFAPEFSNMAATLAAALQEHEWQVCYFGFTEPWSPSRQLAMLDGPYSLQQVHGCTTTHAYLVRETARDWILNQLPAEDKVWRWLAAHRAIDRWYQRQLGLRFPVTCISPSIINQNASASDIVMQPSPLANEGGRAAAVVARSSGNVSYYLCHALRRVSVRVGLAGDVLRGWTRKLRGF